MRSLVRRGRPVGLDRARIWPFEGLFGDLFENLESELPFRWPVWESCEFSPAVEVRESGKEVTVTAEVPGIEKDELDISVQDGTLTLKGEKKREEEHNEGDSHRVERLYGRFERRIALSEHVDREHVEATYKNGVLTIRLPKLEGSKTTRVVVKEG